MKAENRENLSCPQKDSAEHEDNYAGLGWVVRRRIRMYIWKQWKLPKTRVKNLIQLGIPDWAAYRYGNSRKGYWRLSGTTTLARAISNKRLAHAGYYSILDRYESLHLCD